MSEIVNKTYATDDLIDDYQPMVIKETPTIATNVAPVVAQSILPKREEMKKEEVKDEVAKTKENEEKKGVAGAKDTEMVDIEGQMARIAIDGLNRKREATHNDIDKHYDELIEKVRAKIKSLSDEIAQGITEK